MKERLEESKKTLRKTKDKFEETIQKLNETLNNLKAPPQNNNIDFNLIKDILEFIKPIQDILEQLFDVNDFGECTDDLDICLNYLRLFLLSYNPSTGEINLKDLETQKQLFRSKLIMSIDILNNIYSLINYESILNIDDDIKIFKNNADIIFEALEAIIKKN